MDDVEAHRLSVWSHPAETMARRAHLHNSATARIEVVVPLAMAMTDGAAMIGKLRTRLVRDVIEGMRLARTLDV